MSLSRSVLYRFDDYELNLVRRTLTRDGSPVALSPKAFEVLAHLVANPATVVTKEELLHSVWPESFVEEGNVAQHVSSLRKAFADRAHYIVTVPGRGYQFTAQVRETVSDTTVVQPVDNNVVGSNEDGLTFQTVHRVRERTRVVVEETIPVDLGFPSPAAGPLALAAGSSRFPRGLAVAALVLVVAAAAGWRWLHHKAPAYREVVVADFTSGGADEEAFDRTLKRALEIDLEQSPYLDVLSERGALTTLQMMELKPGTVITTDVAREICVRTNRHVLLAGKVAIVGGEYLVTLEATDCNSGKRLATAKAQASTKAKVLEALDTVADHVRRSLGESAKSLNSYDVPIHQATTASLEALQAYSAGATLNELGKDQSESLPLFQRAVELDPSFAMAYGQIANDYYNLSEFKLASQNYKKAMDLSGNVNAKERLVLQAHYYAEGVGDRLQGIKTYQLWAATYPRESAPAVNIIDSYTQIGQYAAAISEGERALAAYESNSLIYSTLARAYADDGRFDEALSVAAKAIRNGKDSEGLHSTMFQIAVARHNPDSIHQEMVWAENHASGWYAWYFPYLQASVAAAAGHYALATAYYRKSYDVAISAGLVEAADDVLTDEAETEVSLGLRSAARATLGRLRNPTADVEDLALVHAQLGDVAFAEQFIARHASETSDTLMANVYLPQLRSVLDMQDGRPAEAIADLDIATPYELKSYVVLYERGQAYLRAGEAQAAAAQYQKILVHPGSTPISVLYPLAHFGLARAYALQHNAVDSRKEYGQFLELWRDADEDLPVLKQARLEFAQVK